MSNPACAARVPQARAAAWWRQLGQPAPVLFLLAGGGLLVAGYLTGRAALIATGFVVVLAAYRWLEARW